MKILGIETSCDETAAAVLETKGKSIKILSNVVSSQIKIHKKYGGVVPEVAARKHAEVIFEVVAKALTDANNANKMRMPRTKSNTNKIDLIAVTYGPGLVTSLRVGVLAAQSIAGLKNIPLVGVNHIEAHLLSPLLPRHCERSGAERGNLVIPHQVRDDGGLFPALGLIVSGGHTELVLMRDFGKYKLIGETRDDAVGEAFDKVAKMLNLGYPGGPAISKQVSKWKKQDTRNKIQDLPRPMMNTKNFDFSFSGLKTATLYLTKKLSKKELKKMTPAICQEFQNAVIDVLIHKTKKAAEKYKVKSILVGGGVSANKELRSMLRSMLRNKNIYLPDLEYTGDNAAMIAFAGWQKYKKTRKDEVLRIKAEPNLKI